MNWRNKTNDRGYIFICNGVSNFSQKVRFLCSDDLTPGRFFKLYDSTSLFFKTFLCYGVNRFRDFQTLSFVTIALPWPRLSKDYNKKGPIKIWPKLVLSWIFSYIFQYFNLKFWTISSFSNPFVGITPSPPWLSEFT